MTFAVSNCPKSTDNSKHFVSSLLMLSQAWTLATFTSFFLFWGISFASSLLQHWTHDWIDGLNHVPDLTGPKHSLAGFFLLSCCVIKCFRWELVHLPTSKQIRCLLILPAYSEKRFSNCESCRRVSSECVQGSKEMDLNCWSVGVLKGWFTGWTKNSSENNFTHLNPCNKAFPDI